MKNFQCDIAMLPIGGTYTMDADAAAQAAVAVKAKTAIPMHYGDIVGSPEDAEEFRDILKGKVEVRILESER
jgi:L-ascorbate metabolism protein UlaG (beta-lactamase superfamily)